MLPFFIGIVHLLLRSLLKPSIATPIGLETLDPLLESLDLVNSPFTNLVILATGIILVIFSTMSHSDYFPEDTYVGDIISPEELADLHPMMPGQSNIPSHEGKNPTQILQEARKLQGKSKAPPSSKGRQHQGPPKQEKKKIESKDTTVCNPLNCHQMEIMNGFIKSLESSSDPLSLKVLESVNQVSLLNSANANLLKSRYTLLIRNSGKDWDHIKPEIINSAKCSYNSLYHTIEGMLKVFQLQHSKTINDNIVLLGDVTDNIKAAAKNMKSQAEMNDRFNKDLSKQLNTLTSSIAQCMDKLDQKTLESHHPSRHPCYSKMGTPSANSESIQQDDLPGKIEAIPNIAYKNQLLRVSFDSNKNICASPQSPNAKPLVELCRLPVKSQVIVNLLNADLNMLLKKLQLYPHFVQNFINETDRDNKIKMLKETFEEIPERSNQWFRDMTSA